MNEQVQEAPQENDESLVTYRAKSVTTPIKGDLWNRAVLPVEVFA